MSKKTALLMPVSTNILHLEHWLWNYNTIISVVIHIKAYTIRDPCTHNINHKIIILVVVVFIKSTDSCHSTCSWAIHW